MEYFATGLSVLIGALVTLIAARIYYQKASTDLVKEAQELHKLNILMLRALEQAGLAEFSRDSDGNICGLVINLKVQSSSHSHTSDNVEITLNNND